MTAKDLELAELEHRFWMQRELTLLWIETSKLPNAEARGKVSRLATNPLTAVREAPPTAQPGESASPANVGTKLKRNWVNDILDDASRTVASWPAWMRRPEFDWPYPGAHSESDQACAICGCAAGEHGPAHRFEVAA